MKKRPGQGNLHWDVLTTIGLEVTIGALILAFLALFMVLLLGVKV